MSKSHPWTRASPRLCDVLLEMSKSEYAKCDIAKLRKRIGEKGMERLKEEFAECTDAKFSKWWNNHKKDASKMKDWAKEGREHRAKQAADKAEQAGRAKQGQGEDSACVSQQAAVSTAAAAVGFVCGDSGGHPGLVTGKQLNGYHEQGGLGTGGAVGVEAKKPAEVEEMPEMPEMPLLAGSHDGAPPAPVPTLQASSVSNDNRAHDNDIGVDPQDQGQSLISSGNVEDNVINAKSLGQDDFSKSDFTELYAGINVRKGNGGRIVIAGDFLGGGSGGKVFAVKRKKGDSDKYKAVKVIRDIDIHSIEEVKTEVRALKELTGNNHTLRFEDAFYDGKWKIAFIVTEFCQVGSLLDVVLDLHKKGDTLGEEKIRSVLRQIMSGLDHIHTHNVIHRDMKLQNIFVKLLSPIYVVIGDVGISRFTIDEKVENYTRRIGTKRYSGPEMNSNRIVYPRSRGGKMEDVQIDNFKENDVYGSGAAIIDAGISASEFAYESPTDRANAFLKRYPAGGIASRMIQTNPHDRPKVSEVAEDPWVAAAQQFPKY